MTGLGSSRAVLAFVVLAGVFLLVGAILVVAYVVSPETRRQLAYLREESGVGPGIGAAVTAVLFVALVSVFAMGGTTSGRYDYPLAFAAVGLLAGLFLSGVAVAALSDYRLLVRTPAVDTGAVGSGRVAVTGEVTPAGEPPSAPFSGEPAVCWECWVKERDVREEGMGVQAESVGVEANWTVELADEGRARFRVDDGSGPVAVDPREAELRLGEDREWFVPFGEDPPERILGFVEDRLADVGYAGNDRRYEETRLSPGDEATVVGTAVAGPRGESDAARDGQSSAGRAEAPLADGDGPRRIDGSTGRCIVAAGSLADARADLRRRFTSAGGAGLALSVLAYAGMLAAAGVL